jgi:hypothetical protein
LQLPCPYLNGEVELTEERIQHIREGHPDLLRAYQDRIAETLLAPDEVRCSARSKRARLFSRWFDDMMGGKHVVVVVLSDTSPVRRWVVTAYLVSKLGPGVSEWKQN